MKIILVDAVDTFVIETEDGFKIFDDMYKILEEFPNRKIILTSASDVQMKKFGLNEMPYEVFTLKHDPEKTDSEYYETMLKYFNLKAEDVVYFEHNPDAVESAHSVSITTYYYDKDTKDLDTLKKFLDDKLKPKS